MTKASDLCIFRQVMLKVALSFFKTLILCNLFILLGLQQISLAYEPPLTSSKKICNSLLINAELEANQSVVKNTLLKLFMSDYPIFFQPAVTRTIARMFTFYLSPPKETIPGFNLEVDDKIFWILDYYQVYNDGRPSHYLRDNFKDLIQNIAPFRDEYKKQSMQAATSVWKKIVNVIETTPVIDLIKNFSILKNPAELNQIKTLVLVVDSSPRLKTLMHEAIIDFFFQSEEFKDLSADYNLNRTNEWNFNFIKKESTQYKNGNLSGIDFMLKRFEQSNLIFFKNRPTLLDIAQFKEENVSELLLDGVKAEGMNFENFQMKISNLIDSHAELYTPSKVSAFQQELRMIVHSLNLLTQGNYERFQANPLWPRLKISTVDWLKATKDLSSSVQFNARHEQMRTNFQAIAYLGNQITLHHQLLENLLDVQTMLHEQLVRLQELNIHGKNEKLKALHEQSIKKGLDEMHFLIENIHVLVELNLKRTEHLEELLKSCQELEKSLQFPDYVELVKIVAKVDPGYFKPEVISLDLSQFIKKINNIFKVGK